MTGYCGALVALTLSTYPYVYLLFRVGTAEARIRRPRSGPQPRSGTRSRLHAGHAAGVAPVDRRGIASRVALYVLSDFGVVSLMGYSTLTTGIYVRYESLLALESAAILALVLVALALAIVLIASRFRLRSAIPEHAREPAGARLRWT